MSSNSRDVAGEKNPKYRHGLTVRDATGRMKPHAVYTAYQNMMSRCYNSRNEKYHRYGGRGVIVCFEWRGNPAAFAEWSFANGWSQGLTIDRIDNDGNYEPSNCRWTTKSKNSQKKSTTKLTYHQSRAIFERCKSGENEYDIAREFGVTHGTVWFIVNEMTWKQDYN